MCLILLSFVALLVVDLVEKFAEQLDLQTAEVELFVDLT